MTKTRTLLLASLAAALAAPAAMAAPPTKLVRIPFADHGGIRDFRPDGDRAVYLQDRARHWYRATLFGPCFDLPYANAIGYQTDGTGSFDWFSSIVVRGQRCPVDTLAESAPPAETRKAGKPRGG